MQATPLLVTKLSAAAAATAATAAAAAALQSEQKTVSSLPT
jgi:hypothetical protein